MEVGEVSSEDRERKHRVQKVVKVKNKQPAQVQVTAEQLLREAKERELEITPLPPKNKISDPEELAAYQQTQRKDFEDNIRKNRLKMKTWLRYAAWEESQSEMQRARSVYERALDITHRNIQLWLRYTDMEMRTKNINHARNLWDRAVTILPRADQLWYKYVYMEEMLENIGGARQVFERWMKWEPNEQAWQTYVNFELRYKELDRARLIYERFVIIHPKVQNWIKYARFEERNGFISSARQIYERAVEYFGDEDIDEHLLNAFARFEEQHKEFDRARSIYKFALDRLPKERCERIYKEFSKLEKRFGEKRAIDEVITSKRRFHYEERLKENPHNYDDWFSYIRLVEQDSPIDEVRDLYERAIANIPLSKNKNHWRRYIYLWIYYAIYEELAVEDMSRARQVYQACIDLLPHKHFTFSKLWILYAQFEIRQRNVDKARKLLGMAIGRCPKEKTFRAYIDLEIKLREFDRCRMLYQKFLEFNPENCNTWMKFAELESILGDTDRARAIYELAVKQEKLDMPEILWKTYIDFERELKDYSRCRQLYRRLLQRTMRVKVWLSYAKFEQNVETNDNALDDARAVYEEACRRLKELADMQHRVILLEAWLEFENEFGDIHSQDKVKALQPQRVKKRRKIVMQDGTNAGWEEYYDYIFPDEETSKPHLKLLAMAKKWKEAQKADSSDSDSDVDEDDDSVGPPKITVNLPIGEADVAEEDDT